MNNKGFSLIEVMIAGIVLGIISMSLMSTISNQNKELKASDEKMSLQNLQVQISSLLSSGAFCRCFMGLNTFHYGTKIWNGLPTSIGTSYNVTCSPVGGNLLALNTPIGNSNLKPSGMSLQTITETMVGSGSFSANLVIQFNPTILLRPRKPLSIPFYFSVNMTDPVASRNLVSCSANSSSSSGVSSSFTVYTSYTPGSKTMSCPAGSLLTACYAETSSTDGQSLIFMQHLTLGGAPGKLSTCSSTMTDSNDLYRLVLICVQ